MNLFQKVGESLSSATKKAAKRIDKAKLELKLKGYYKEERQLYQQIGLDFYLYHRSNTEDETLSSLCLDIDNIKHRQLSIERLIQALNRREAEQKDGRSSEKNQPENINPKYLQTNFKLNKNESDLTITRTENGIQLLRFCPECHLGNNPNDRICRKCGHEFTRES